MALMSGLSFRHTLVLFSKPENCFVCYGFTNANNYSLSSNSTKSSLVLSAGMMDPIAFNQLASCLLQSQRIVHKNVVWIPVSLNT